MRSTVRQRPGTSHATTGTFYHDSSRWHFGSATPAIDRLLERHGRCTFRKLPDEAEGSKNATTGGGLVMVVRPPHGQRQQLDRDRAAISTFEPMARRSDLTTAPRTKPVRASSAHEAGARPNLAVNAVTTLVRRSI